eukprot:scaffold14756_cov63-Attheya_sp.AAC.2
MIHTVQEFDEIVDDLEFTEAHEKFINFRKCLRDVARDDWGTMKVRQANTIAGFKATIYAWKLMILPPEDIYEAQKKYIKTVKKPYTMTVHDFIKRICLMASYLPEFPKLMAVTTLAEIDLKNIVIFRGMPNASWQESCVHIKLSPIREEKIILKAVVLVAEIAVMDKVTIQVEDMDIKDVPIKEEDMAVVTVDYIHGGHGNGGDRNDAYQNDAASNPGSNHNVPSAASTDTNPASRSRGVDRTNASGWGALEERVDNYFTPINLVAINTIQCADARKAMVPLLDTAAGKLELRNEVDMKGIVCPEFTRSKRMDNLTAYVIESRCHYDVSLGQDFLEATGMVLDFSKKKVIWDELSAAMMKPMILIDTGQEASYDAMMTDLINEETEYLFDADCYHYTCDKMDIQPSDYHKVEIDDIETDVI